MSLSKNDERQWVGWKALASIEEILPRLDPTKLDDRCLMNIDAPVVALMLHDLDPVVAEHWAWTLWVHHKSFLECRNRRGDLQWRTSLDKLDDPREIIPVSDNRFLLSCSTSIGWFTADGEYEPILTGLGSASWIRYHPTEPWIVMDGATNTAIIYDPTTKKEIGRLELDDGGSGAKSRFLTPTGYLAE